ncbi:MAG: phosphonate ABC transporter, permease protein PhnE [Bosea sp.]|nr:phosphonate ABC transporter, permease protein PhnE [Bosea sp. (in: a-proteobacteria)]
MSASPARRTLADAFPANWTRRALLLLLVGYIVYAAGILQITWARFLIGLDQGAIFLQRMWPPNVQAQKVELIKDGMLESLQIAVLATAFGVLLALPLGLMAARNLAPSWLSWTARAFIALLRTFHPVIVAILFVKAVGFGALAGVLALVVASMGFVGKLFAEAIEEISMKQVEAVRATGAGFLGVLIMGVLPQVMARFVGFVIYQLDSNLRNSTMVGIVGGGGIGATLFTAYQRFDYDVVLTILLVIIAIIMAFELISTRIRKVFQ